MGLSLSSWKSRARELLKTSIAAPAAKVGTIYGTLLAAGVWPVVEAYRSGSESAAAGAFVTVLGAGAASLFASEIKSWADSHTGATLDQLADHLMACTEADKDIRETLDSMADRLDLIEEVAQVATARQLRQLTDELSRLGNLDRFRVTFRDAG